MGRDTRDAPNQEPRVTLADYYREHGESDHLHQLEQALTDDWQTTTELADTAGLSRNFVAQATAYLHSQGRARRRQSPIKKPMYGQRWRYEWRRP